MTLPSTGPISFADINAELGLPVGTVISLNDPAVRDIAGIPSGSISFGDLRGKSAEFFYDYTAGGQNKNVRTIADAAGFEGGTGKTVRIRVSGAAISASSTSVPALEIGSWPSGTKLTLEVATSVIGKGGAGGGTASAGGAGGPALKASTPVSGGGYIQLTMISGGFLYGGGGGGGGGNTTVTHSGGNTLDRTNVTSTGGTGGRGAGSDGGATGGGTRAGSGGYYGANGGGGGGGGGGAAGYAFISNGYARPSINFTSGSTYLGLVN